MLEGLFSAWKKADLLTQAINDSNEMLEIAYKMYKSSVELLESDYSKEKEEEIRKKDYLLNHFEKSIRRKAFEHITINTQDQNLYSAVLVLSIVGNIERLGDYCKNICEAAEIKDRLFSSELNKKMSTYIAKVDSIFKETIIAYKNAASDIASKVNDKYNELKSEIDEHIMELAILDDVDGKNYVLYALVFRYLKRLSAHLMHITSSLTNPIDKIGYYLEDNE